MSILSAELVALLERLAKTLPLPNVRALHLPALSAAGTRDGEFCAIELDDGSPGLSFVLLGDTLVTLDAGELARCDKVLSTSTVLLNHTLDAVLERCRHAERFALIGPGAGCLPDPLFACCVTLLGGSWIVNPAGFKAALPARKPRGGFARKFALGREHYPGFDRLLALACGQRF